MDAYDVASATLKAGGSIDIVVQPLSSPGDVIFLVVSSDIYDAGLTYTIIDGGPAHALDAPHVMLGAGAVGFMNSGSPPQTLKFSSALAKEANIQVVAGRKNPKKQ